MLVLLIYASLRTTLLEIRMSSGNLHLDAPTIMLQLYNVVLDLDYRFVSRLLLVLVGQLQKVQMAVDIINIYRPPSFYCTADHKLTHAGHRIGVRSDIVTAK